jgi:hypothetical protein
VAGKNRFTAISKPKDVDARHVASWRLALPFTMQTLCRKRVGTARRDI